MKRILKTSVYLFILSILLQSCYTHRPTAHSVSSPDYNQRASVAGAQYKKKGNALDIVFNVGLIGAGAYGGYNLNLVQQQTATGKEPVRVANAAIGALAGASIAYLIDQAAGKNRIDPVRNPNDWIRKANNDYRLLRGDNVNFTIIHTSAEKSYTVNNINDVRDFKTAFPNSSQTDNIFLEAMNRLDRSSLPDLIDLFPTNRHAEDAKMKYIVSSPSYDEISAAVKKYPVPNPAELCVEKIENITNSLNFANTFNSFNNKRLAVANTFKSEATSISELNQLKNAYGQDFNLTANDLSDKSGIIRKNYFKAMYLLQSPKSVEQFDSFNLKYTWLSYLDKKTDLLSLYWDIIEPRYSKGTDVLKKFGEGLSNQIYADIKISQEDFKKVIDEKFRKIIEVDKKVEIINTQSIGSDDTQWEKWNKSAFTAMIVQEEGEISYIIYGEIKNNSKFDLPVEVKAAGILYSKISAKAGNDELQKIFDKIDEGASFLSSFLPGDIYNQSKQALKSESEKDIAAQSGNYYFPIIPAGEKFLYAVKIDFGTGEKKIGMNFLGLGKMGVELKLRNERAVAVYYPKPVSVEQLKLQSTWQNFAINGLPAGKLYDKFWGEGVEFNQTGYDVALDYAWKGFVTGVKVAAYIKAYSSDDSGGRSSSYQSSGSGTSALSSDMESNSNSNSSANNTTTTDWSKYYLKVESQSNWVQKSNYLGITTYESEIQFTDGWDGGMIYKEVNNSDNKIIRFYSGDDEIDLNLKNQDDAIHCLAIRKHHRNEYSNYFNYLKEKNRK